MIANQYKENLFFSLALILSILTFFTICMFFKHLTIFSPKIDAGFFLDPSTLRPQSFANFCFFLGIFYLPVTGMFFYKILAFFDSKLNRLFSFTNVRYAGSTVNILMLLALLTFVRHLQTVPTAYFPEFDVYLKHFSLPLISILLLYLLFNRSEVREVNPAFFLIFGIAILILTSLTQIITDAVMINNIYANYHFSCLLGAVNHAFHGKTFLVDVYSQYGILYPYFGAIFAKIFGMSPVTISWFFVSLTFISYLFIFFALSNKLGYNSWVTLVFFIAILGITHPFYESVILLLEATSICYQYFPLRFLFGSFFVWFSLKYLKNRNSFNYVISLCMCALGFLWNTDTGVTLVLSWTGFLIYDTLSAGLNSAKDKIFRCFRHLFLVALTVALAVIFYNIFAYIRTQRLPSWERLFEFQQIIIKTGYFSLPLKLIDYWNVPIFIYLVTILSCLIALLNKKVTDSERFYFFLALLGVGIFTYYYRRSIIVNLFPVSYPALILVACFLNELTCKYDYKKYNFKRLLKNTLFHFNFIKILAMALLFGYGLLVFFSNAFAAIQSAKNNIFSLSYNNKNSKVEEVKDFIMANKKNKEIFIFSDIADYLYCRTDTTPVYSFSSLNEVYTFKQAQEIKEIIANKKVKQIFVFKTEDFRDGMLESLIMPIIKENYIVKKTSNVKDADVILYETE